MFETNVAGFLRKVRLDSSLAEQMRTADTYEAIAEISERAGEPTMADKLRTAFTARNAGVLVREMMRRGVIDAVELMPIPPMDPELWSRVAAMDLGPVTSQLTHKGWTTERAASAERRYRRFFYLKAILPEGMASPTQEVDEFWHQHIINTRRYGPDCHRVIGRFAHHTFLSFDDPVEARELLRVWLSTWVCYEALFEEPYEQTIGTALLHRWPKA